MTELEINAMPPTLLPDEGVDVFATFEGWVGTRSVPNIGTNAGTRQLAFQGWRHFKEAFAPELVARAVDESTIPVRRCLDPFGGSGTTALACQFLGVSPVTIEVNPYLADLIEAKLCPYDLDALAIDAGYVVNLAKHGCDTGHQTNPPGPQTLIEPGVQNQWVFDRAVADNILALVAAIEGLSDERNRRLFKVVLGGQLVRLSNVRISGKGRRYRGGWKAKPIDPEDVFRHFVEALTAAVHDITLHRNRSSTSYQLLRGDARALVADVEPVDLVAFSPPYPNSFDYTDVYNLELWMLGYLQDRAGNTKLRQATLTSHVQLQRSYAAAPQCSPVLTRTLERLEERRGLLWHKDIPAMIGGYFADLEALLLTLQGKLTKGARTYMVVGDSQYAGVPIPVATILAEVAQAQGYDFLDSEASRSMRSSAQQGGHAVLPETMLVLGT
jgi:hypothetical protein